MTLPTNLSAPNVGGLIQLFELDLNGLPGAPTAPYLFHAGTNVFSGNVVWQGRTYTAIPIEAAGFDVSGNGPIPRPTFKIANGTGILSAMLREYDDMIGAKVTRHRTLSRYLDAVNFPNHSNPTADPNVFLPDELYYVDRKAGENKLFIEVELAPAWDLNGIKLPRRQYLQNVCSWKYRGAECGYVGGSYWDSADQAVGTLAQDVCGKRLSSCKLRFGRYAQLPYGGFPGVGIA